TCTRELRGASAPPKIVLPLLCGEGARACPALDAGAGMTKRSEGFHTSWCRCNRHDRFQPRIRVRGKLRLESSIPLFVIVGLDLTIQAIFG
ncbi:MAG: hypothetical protein Q8O43_10310, partial [Dehalococcoidia bacterium]|nr:hypothetical protein [Dehalococcoidia bacterium]